MEQASPEPIADLVHMVNKCTPVWTGIFRFYALFEFVKVSTEMSFNFVRRCVFHAKSIAESTVNRSRNPR